MWQVLSKNHFNAELKCGIADYPTCTVCISSARYSPVDFSTSPCSLWLASVGAVDMDSLVVLGTWPWGCCKAFTSTGASS